MKGSPVSMADHLPTAQLVSGLLHEADGFAQVRPHGFGRAVDGVLVGSRRRPAAPGRAAARGPRAPRPAGVGRGELRAEEIGIDPLVETVKDRSIDILEIEGQARVEGPAHSFVLEFVAAQVEHEALHDAAGALRKLLLDDTTSRTAGMS